MCLLLSSARTRPTPSCVTLTRSQSRPLRKLLHLGAVRREPVGQPPQALAAGGGVFAAQGGRVRPQGVELGLEKIRQSVKIKKNAVGAKCSRGLLNGESYSAVV